MSRRSGGIGVPDLAVEARSTSPSLAHGRSTMVERESSTGSPRAESTGLATVRKASSPGRRGRQRRSPARSGGRRGRSAGGTGTTARHGGRRAGSIPARAVQLGVGHGPTDRRGDEHRREGRWRDDVAAARPARRRRRRGAAGCGRRWRRRTRGSSSAQTSYSTIGNSSSRSTSRFQCLRERVSSQCAAHRRR